MFPELDLHCTIYADPAQSLTAAGEELQAVDDVSVVR